MRRLTHKLKQLAAMALVSVAVSVPAYAHHSIAKFDGRQTVRITGIVKQFLWVNPHVVIELEGTLAGDKSTRRWSVEMSPPNTLLDAGWSRDTLAVGDKITITANPLRTAAAETDGRVRVLYTGVVLASGRTFGKTASQ